MFNAFPLLLLVVAVYNLVALGGAALVGMPEPAADTQVVAAADESADPEAPAEAADPAEADPAEVDPAEAADPAAGDSAADPASGDPASGDPAGGDPSDAAEAPPADGDSPETKAEQKPFSTDDVMRSEFLSVPMPSGSRWRLTYGDVFVIIGLILLFVELVRSTATSGNVLVNHGLSLGVLVLCLIEFIIVKGFATSTFFLIMLMAAIDVVAGFVISIRGARRDLAVGG